MAKTAVFCVFSLTLIVYAVYFNAVLNAQSIDSNTRHELADIVQGLALNGTEVALVSFFRHQHRSPDARSQLLRIKKTTWLFYVQGFKHFLEMNAQQEKMTVAIVTDLRIGLKLFGRLIQSRFLYYSAVHWILVRDIDDMQAERQAYEKISPPVRLSVLGCSGGFVINALIYSFSQRRPVYVSAVQLPRTIKFSKPPWSEKREKFSGNILKLGCLYLPSYRKAKTSALNPSLCHAARYTQLLRLLEHKNLSLTYRLLFGPSPAISALTDGDIDLIVSKTNLEGTSLTLMSYAEVNVAYDTFYARANDSRTKSVFEVFAYSTAGMYLTVTCMVACALMLTFLSGIHSPSKLVVNFLREAMFLLAALLATSSPESPFQEHRRMRRLLCLFWYLGILSLSLYIRSEITASVTVTGPADHLDTLEELESALDRRTVAPCVLKGSSTQSILESTTETSPSTFMRKLAAAYRSHNGKELVTETPVECLLRAGRRDRVCYSPLQPRCAVERVARGVRPFPEPFTMVLEGFPVRHGYSFLPALRKLFFAVREASLSSRIEDFCNYEAGGLIEVKIDLQQFINLYFIVQLVSVAAFGFECLIRLILASTSR